jgi:hypothetical protein
MAMYRAGQRRPGLPAGPGEAGRPQPVAGDGEAIRLRAEVAQLRADLASAREAAHAAWRDASEPDSPGPDLRSRLLADPLSGARHLPGSGQ